MKKVDKRRKEMLEIIDDMRHITINELSEMMDVSHLTIRRDLKILEKKENIYVAYGGMVFSNSEVPNFEGRKKQNAAVKAKIAVAATEYVQDKDVIFIGGGTTCVEFAKALASRCEDLTLTIVTSCAKVASIVSRMPSVSIQLLGGEYVNENESITSITSIEVLERLNFDKSFVSCLGISEKKGAMYMYYTLARAKRIIAVNSKKCIMMADAEKIGKYSMSSGIDLNDIDVLITDCKESEELKRIAGHNIEIDTI